MRDHYLRIKHPAAKIPGNLIQQKIDILFQLGGYGDRPGEIRRRLTDAMPLKLGYPYEWMAGNLVSNFSKVEIEPRHAIRLP